MSRQAIFLALVAASVVVGGALDAQAYCRSTTCSGNCARDGDGCKTEGAFLTWASSCVGFSVQSDGSEHIDLDVLRDVFTRSFVAWSDIECAPGEYASMAFSPYPDAACHKAEYNEDGPNANILMIQDYRWDYTSADNTLAKTTVTYDADSGDIFDADIEFNHAYNAFSTSDSEVVYDLQSIVTHEIGHFIGLDHTLDVVATMNAGYQKGTTELRSLEYDDIDAVCATYPPLRLSICAPEPKGGFASECAATLEAQGESDGGCSLAHAPGRSPATDWAWLGSAALALGLHRRSRRGPRHHSATRKGRT